MHHLLVLNTRNILVEEGNMGDFRVKNMLVWYGPTEIILHISAIIQLDNLL